MCCHADPVRMAQIDCLSRFSGCSLAQGGVSYVCMAQRRASQLTHSISREGGLLEKRTKQKGGCLAFARTFSTSSSLFFAGLWNAF